MNTLLQSESLDKLAPALAKAQAAMGVALKDSTNPHFRSKYADLTSIITASRDALADNGLAVVQRPHPNERGVQLETTIVHASGQWISDGGLFLPASKLDPQGFGSAMTYARRYAYAAMLGIVQDDDDGSAASQPARTTQNTQPARIPATPPSPQQTAVQTLQEAFDATVVDDEYVFKFGKHKGKSLAEVPTNYLDWLLQQPAKDGYEQQHADAHAMYRRELHRREQAVA